MNMKKRSILLSVLTLLLCLAMMAGGSYALFTAKTELKTHLKAGSLNVELWRTSVSSYTIDPDTGLMTNESSSNPINLTGSTNVNAFGLSTAALLVPRSSYTANLRLINSDVEGSVAFVYWVELKITEGADLDIADQIEVSVVTPIGSKSGLVSNTSGSIGSEQDYAGRVTRGETQDFTVTVTFVDSADNNDAMGQSVKFDLIIHAVQYVPAQGGSNN